jgi:hypothetical protein
MLGSTLIALFLGKNCVNAHAALGQWLYDVPFRRMTEESTLTGCIRLFRYGTIQAISIVKPTRYTVSQIYFILEQQSTCFGRSLRPSSGV